MKNLILLGFISIVNFYFIACTPANVDFSGSQLNNLKYTFVDSNNANEALTLSPGQTTTLEFKTSDTINEDLQLKITYKVVSPTNIDISEILENYSDTQKIKAFSKSFSIPFTVKNTLSFSSNAEIKLTLQSELDSLSIAPNEYKILISNVAVIPPSIAFNTLSYINNLNKTIFTVTGTCSNISDFKLIIHTLEYAVTCVGGSWIQIVDTTSLDDGIINLKVKNSLQTFEYANTTATKDTILPITSGLNDGSIYNSLTETPLFGWSGSDIGGSGIMKYEIALGTSSVLQNIYPWTDIGTLTSKSINSLSLTDATIYFVQVRATDAAGNIGTAIYGDGYLVDTSTPVATLANTPSNPTATGSYNITVSGSGIVSYKYKLGLSNTTICGINTGYSAETPIANHVSGALGTADSYRLCVIGKNSAETWQSYSSATSYTWVFDNVNPTLIGSITNPSYYSSLSASPNFTWAAGSDANSGILTYKIAIGSNIDGSDILGWTDIGNATSKQIASGLSLSEATIYHVTIKVIDNAGNASVHIHGSWTTDTSGPSAPSIVTDGDQWVLTAASVSWSPSTDSGSGINRYEVRILDNYALQIEGWTNAGYNPLYNFNTLVSLTAGNVYHAEVRAIDNAGNASTSTQGDGWLAVTPGWKSESFIKASNAEASDRFGSSASIDGDTLVVGAFGEDSNQTTITNNSISSSDNNEVESGAIYVYKRTWNNTLKKYLWAQEAYIKAPNSESFDSFGKAVSISNDTIVVGAQGESSSETTITNGSTASSDNSAPSSGAAYVFRRSSSSWVQEAYLKAPNAESGDNFGYSVAISNDTIVVGAFGEDSNQTTVTNGATSSSDNSASTSGAAYVFKRSGATWSHEAYLKAPNSGSGDSFGYSVAISNDTIVVGAHLEDSNQTTVTNGASASSDNSASTSGAAYVFKRSGATWSHEAYLKAPNSESNDWFGHAVAISNDTIVIGAPFEQSNQTTITNGPIASGDNSAYSSGAAYVFKRSGSNWSHDAYLKAPNTSINNWFGYSVGIYNNIIAVGAHKESSNQTTITNGSTASGDTSSGYAGAVYIFKYTAGWSSIAYIKAPNNGGNDNFGAALAINNNSVVVSSPNEDSSVTIGIQNEISGFASDEGALDAGAAYIFKFD